MRLKLFQSARDQLVHENALYKFIFLCMSIVIVVQGYAIYMVLQHTRTILVPPKITSPITFTDDFAPDEYIRDWAYYISALAFSHTPETAAYQFKDLMRLYDPSAAPQASVVWLQMAKDIEETNVTTVFNLKPSTIAIVPAKKTLTFNGWRTRYKRNLPVSSALMEYIIKYKIEFGKFSILNIQEREIKQ